MSNRRSLFVIGGAFVFLSTAALTTHYIQKISPKNTNSTPSTPAPSHLLPSLDSPGQNERINAIYDGLAREYDDKVGHEEWITGVKRLRKKLLRKHAEGDVLEIACGTGRNIDFYPYDRLTSLTLVEQSPQMVRVMSEKVDPTKRLAKSKHEKDIFRNHISLVQCDAHNLAEGLKKHRSVDCEGKYDVVVDTFGLCSFEDPVRVLREMSRVCKPTGKILLLEHGRSEKWKFMDRYLDRNMETRFRDWGCIWNKDIDQIVEEAGLVVVEKKRKHFGTTYVFVCKPNKVGNNAHKSE